MPQRVSEERLALLQEAHSSVSISGPGAWDGMDLNALVADLRDSRAEVAALKARLAAMERVVEAAKSMRATANASPADADFGAAAQAWDEGRDELMVAVDALAALRSQGDAGAKEEG